jgi:HK97 gp10 family phage protein
MSFRIEGAGDLIKSIESLADDVRKNAEKNVLSAAARPLERAVKAAAAGMSDTGALAASIGLNVKKGKRGGQKGNYTARVGPRKGFARTDSKGQRRDPVKYAHLVEYGTSLLPARPFIRPALEAAKGDILSRMATALEKHIARALKRRAKKRAISK